ncbi:MAG TPA: hypothetical protein VG692_01925 [Gemmatimonadales bacterium]|nr:hypothetical protein [Gemmatimonadales bacterium]
MRSIRGTILLSAAALVAGGALALIQPTSAQAEKTPVDCSGRRTECTTIRNCTEWHDHVCYELTTSFWYWYY